MLSWVCISRQGTLRSGVPCALALLGSLQVHVTSLLPLLRPMVRDCLVEDEDCYRPSMGPWTIAQTGYRKLALKAKVKQKQERQFRAFYGPRRPAAMRGSFERYLKQLMQHMSQIQNKNTSVTTKTFFDIYYMLALGGSLRWEPHGGAILLIQVCNPRFSLWEMRDDNRWSLTTK